MMKKTMGHEEKERAKADLVGVFMIDIEYNWESWGKEILDEMHTTHVLS